RAVAGPARSIQWGVRSTTLGRNSGISTGRARCGATSSLWSRRRRNRQEPFRTEDLSLLRSCPLASGDLACLPIPSRICTRPQAVVFDLLVETVCPTWTPKGRSCRTFVARGDAEVRCLNTGRRALVVFRWFGYSAPAPGNHNRKRSG